MVLGEERPVKLIIAIIKPSKLNEVREALSGLRISGMTVTEVKGYGRQKGHTEIYRGAEYTVNFLPKIRVEVAVPSDVVDQAANAVLTRGTVLARQRLVVRRPKRMALFPPARASPRKVLPRREFIPLR